MNYIELINNFWKKDIEYNFSDKEIALYFYLLSVSNSINWKNPFGLSNSMTIAKFGWGKKSFDTAKNNLKKADLISFKAGDGRGLVYQYAIKNVEKVAQKQTLSATLSDTLSATLSEQKGTTSININKTKQDSRKNEKAVRFTPPTVEEVKLYFEQEKELNSSEAKSRADNFFNFYDSKDWRVGSTKMSNWKSAATRSLNWNNDNQKQQIEYGPSIPKVPDAIRRGG